ncbi:Gfo/Idh/MocA family oxidoreductase [Paraburkholderia lacunae]|uniref:Gfo/Idh/MocA family oxidoreductase n=1 Tax=Paraburkholderia lacunae TaxID=2211104 RepID=UPI001AD841EF|nr:Gfo/Idh/MocA family oxidoreductase [Paraburkholderia lacunae]
MQDKKIRVSIIGYGFVTRHFHMPLISSVPGMQLVAIGTQRPDQVELDDPSIEIISPERAAVAESVDLVIVASVNESHYRFAKLALEAGKHVVVEKPFTPTLNEARELAVLAKRVGRHLAVFQNRRWDSDYLTVRDAIRNESLGDIVHFESHIDRYAPNVPQAWREEPVPAGGTWFDLGPHVADQVLLQFGLPERVTASFAQQRAGARTDDWFTVILEYGRMRVVLRGAQVVPGFGMRFLVHGTKRSVMKQAQDIQEHQLIAGLLPGDPSYGVDPDDVYVFDAADASAQRRAVPATRGDQSQFYVQLERAIRGEGPNPVAPAEAVALIALLEAAAISATEGRSTTLPLTQEERVAFENDRRSHS